MDSQGTNNMPQRLGELVRSLRVARTWTQADLAREAGVSLRTVVRVEAAKGTLKIRPEPLVRIAYALGRPAEELLELAGIELTGEKLRQLTRERVVLGGPLAHAERMPPVAYLERILAKMTERRGPALLCISVANDRAIDNPQTTAVMSGLLEAGLYIAVSSPYPSGSYVAASRSGIPNLARFYNSVFGRVCGIATFLQDLVPERAHQVVVVKLNGQPSVAERQMFRLAAPSIGITDHRPCLFYFPAAVVEERKYASEVELASYMRFGGERPDHWLVVYPSPGNLEEQERASDSRDNWLDYFRDVIRQWEAASGPHRWEQAFAPGQEGHWTLYRELGATADTPAAGLTKETNAEEAQNA
jgi:transcriptional regulator with XRE-family HTH domain